MTVAMVANDFPTVVDLLVAGAGPAGMATALVAALEGLSVIVCEKSSFVGGTAATSAGTLWVPGNSVSDNPDIEDVARADAYLEQLVASPLARDLRSAFFESGPAAIDYFQSRSDVKFISCGRHPDYHSNVAGASNEGRAIMPAPFDGRLLGPNFNRVRPPIGEFLLFGGMMVDRGDILRLMNRYRSWSAFRHSATILLRYFMDRLRHPRGTRLLMGNALVARLYASLIHQRVSVLFEASLVDLTMKDGAVAGAEVSHGNSRQCFETRCGVVLATGGIAHHAAYRKAVMPRPVPVHSMACDSDSGDGVEIAERMGGRLDKDPRRSGGMWTPVSVTPPTKGGKGLFPHLTLDRAKPGLIAVNSRADRFVNEACSYHQFVAAMFDTNDLAPCIPAYLICNAEFVRKYGLGVIPPGTRSIAAWEGNGYIASGSTIAALAGKIGLNAQRLSATITRHNAAAATGRDTDFGKGETDFDRFNGDPAHRPNPCVGPIDGGPFIALAVWPAELSCCAGIATNADGQVLGVGDAVIPGLYAVGNDMASIMRGTDPGPGFTLGPALVFGYRAAMAAARGPSSPRWARP